MMNAIKKYIYIIVYSNYVKIALVSYLLYAIVANLTVLYVELKVSQLNRGGENY